MSFMMVVHIAPKDGSEMTPQDERRLIHKLQQGVNAEFEEEYDFLWKFEAKEQPKKKWNVVIEPHADDQEFFGPHGSPRAARCSSWTCSSSS